MKTPADYHWDLYGSESGPRPNRAIGDLIKQRRLPDDSCFLSIRFPNESRLLPPGALLDNIRNEPTPPEHFHLTLLVAEQCSDDQLALFLANLSPIMPFSIEVTGLKFIEGMDSQVLVWGVDPGPALSRMQSELYNAVVNEDMVISPYSTPTAWLPHITIAYDLDNALNPEDLPPIAPFRLMINSFTIGRSYEDYFEVNLPRGVGDDMFVERHGKHIGQQGTPEGGSQPGFTHAGVSGDGGGLRDSSIPEDIRAMRFFHATDIEEEGLGILVSGEINVSRGGVGQMSPVGGKTYTTSDPEYALIYALGGDIAGDEISKWTENLFKKGEFGYIFEIDTDSLNEIQPDEDSIGEAVHDETYPWLNELAEREFDSVTLREIKDGEYATWAEAGKVLVGRLSQEEKFQLIRDGAHLASEGGLKFSDAWRIDKRDIPNFLGRDYSKPDTEKMRQERVARIWELAKPVGEEPVIERNRHGMKTTVSLSDLAKLVHGEQIVKGVLRRMVGIDDGPFAIERANELYAPTPSFGAAGQGKRGTDGSKQDGSKTGMKKQETGFNADGKKMKWGLPYHVPVELSSPSNEDLQELMDSLEEWEGDGRSIVDELLHEEKKESLDPVEELVEAQIIKWFDNPDAQDIPLHPDRMFGMEDGQIQVVLEREADALIKDRPEIEESESNDPDAAPVLLTQDKVSRGRVYTIGRDGDEIVAIVVTTTVEEDDYRLGLLANGAQAIAYGEDSDKLPPTFRPEHYVDESFETPYLFVDWLAVKYEGHGFGRQMLGEIFRQAAETDSGVYLETIDSAKAFYEKFFVNTTDDDTLFWTAEEVKEWAETVKEETEAFTSDELVEREDISEVAFGTDQPELRPVSEDDDTEPLDGGYTIGNVLWFAKPRPWKRQFRDQIEEASFMTDEDAAVLDAALPPDQRFPDDERETMLQGVQRAMDNLVRSIFKKRHGRHIQQEGEEGQRGGSQPGFKHEEGSVDGEVFHGTGAEAARSIMDSGLQINFADEDNFVSDVVYAASDRRDALNFAARGIEKNYALITIDGSLTGSEPTVSDRGELMFSQDIPAEAIISIEIYERGFQRKDDELIETIERAEEEEASQLFIAVGINDAGEYSILGPTEEQETGVESDGETDAGLDEDEVIENYKVSAYSINRLLRGEEVEHSDDPDDVQGQIDVLDGIMQREDSMLDQDMVLYRGMDLDDQFLRHFDDLEGEIFGYDGYTSASLDQDQLTLTDDGIDNEEKPALVQILALEGTKAFNLSEQEVLLDRGLRFRVTETKTEGDLRIIAVETIPQSSANSGGRKGLADIEVQQEEEAALEAELEERTEHGDDEEDTSQDSDTSQNRDVSTDDETGSESEIDETRRDYWIWEKGEVKLLDKADFEASQEAAGRQAGEGSVEENFIEEKDEPVERHLGDHEGQEGEIRRRTVKRVVVGPLRRVVVDEEEEDGDNVAT